MRRKEAHRIKFLPVQISILWFLIYFSVATTWLTALIAQRYGTVIFTWDEITGKVNLAFVIALQVFILYPPIFYLTNEMLHDMAQLPRHLQEFDIETAKCFCCSNDHVHRATGEHIECDRKLIYGVLHLWSGGSCVEEDSVERIQRVAGWYFQIVFQTFASFTPKIVPRCQHQSKEIWFFSPPVRWVRWGSLDFMSVVLLLLILLPLLVLLVHLRPVVI